MSSVSVREGAVRLETEDDQNPLRRNIFGHPLNGWLSTSLGEGGRFNARGFAMLWLVVQKLVAGKLEDIYNQPMLFENVGSIVVAVKQGCVGLIQSYRMVGERILQAEPDYIARLNREQRWTELFDQLGKWKWEAARGIAPQKVGERFTIDRDLALATAKLEALEEAGFRLENSRICGRVNPNPTFFGHAQYVVDAQVVAQEEQQPEDREIIGKVKFFSPLELRNLVENEELDDGLTLAALAVAGFHF